MSMGRWKLPTAGLMSPLTLRVMYDPGLLEYVANECGGDMFGELSCELGAE